MSDTGQRAEENNVSTRNISGVYLFLGRENLPDKGEEEKTMLAKKLAEQRAKIEGIPTTAKVRCQNQKVLQTLKLLS